MDTGWNAAAFFGSPLNEAGNVFEAEQREAGIGCDPPSIYGHDAAQTFPRRESLSRDPNSTTRFIGQAKGVVELSYLFRRDNSRSADAFGDEEAHRDPLLENVHFHGPCRKQGLRQTMYRNTFSFVTLLENFGHRGFHVDSADE
jgi:hypothetical protein